MSKNLLIVESPAKAKTIEKYLGKDFKVKSSYGHIRDLAKGNDGINIEKDFKPKYVVSPEKKKVVAELKDAVKKVEEVWLATDEDREGEAISWHLCEVLKLDPKTTKRIVFREITKPAITKAIEKPRLVDIDLVNAQQARRILDRLVGFELSEILWKKIRGKLSAGRVQSVAVRLIVEKEREINNFNSTPYYRVTALFDVKNKQGQTVGLKAELGSRLSEKSEAQSFLNDCIGASFKIASIETKPLKRKPAPPFTTSTLQQEASRKLGFSVNRTMSNAQRLYEQGLITYMRTDSTALSNEALGSIGNKIKDSFGDAYHKVRQFKSKSSNAQEAHEAIRPAYIDREQVSSDRDLQRLYELIWKRTIASQMADAELEKTTVSIDISTRPDDQLVAVGEVLKFDGFLKVYLESTDDDEEEEAKGMLPPLTKGEVLNLNHLQATQKFTRPPSRYTEASLVKKLEELGIGRPSTYAPTISKIMEKDRGYVVKESREGTERSYDVLTLKDGKVSEETATEITGSTNNRLYSTDMGMLVTDFLIEHFDYIMNYGFTAEIEDKLDTIANGNKEWERMIKDFYQPFHELVEKTKEEADRASGERILGKDPKTGRTLLVRMAKYGPVVQIGTPEELGEEKAQYANLKRDQSLETITFEEAVELFKLPKTLGTYKGEQVVVATGRYGPYIKFGEKFVNIPRTTDPLELEMEEAQQYIDQKIKEDAPIGTYKGVPITKGKGRFGPFVKYNNLFVNVPKKYDFDNLTEAEAQELVEAKLEKEANRYIHQWSEEKISVENGRWGPFIRFGKKNVKLPKGENGKMTSDEAKELTLEDVKKIIEAELPGSFTKKKKKKV